MYALDAHIEPLLALPSSTSLPSLAPYRDGQLIAQDKASCMPAWVLLAPVLADRLDATESDQEMEDEGDESMAMTDGADDEAEHESRRKRRKGAVKVRRHVFYASSPFADVLFSPGS